MRRRNKKDSNKRKLAWPKTKLGLPDLEHARAAVVGSLTSAGSRREYRRAIDEFVDPITPFRDKAVFTVHKIGSDGM